MELIKCCSTSATLVRSQSWLFSTVVPKDFLLGLPVDYNKIMSHVTHVTCHIEAFRSAVQKWKHLHVFVRHLFLLNFPTEGFIKVYLILFYAILSLFFPSAPLPSSARHVLFLQIGSIIGATEIIGRHLFRLVTAGINAQGWDAKPETLLHYPSLLIYGLVLILPLRLAPTEPVRVCVYLCVSLCVFSGIIIWESTNRMAVRSWY